jgi:hypothetical protein
MGWTYPESAGARMRVQTLLKGAKRCLREIVEASKTDLKLNKGVTDWL